MCNFSPFQRGLQDCDCVNAQRHWGSGITSSFPSLCWRKIPSSRIKYSYFHWIGWPSRVWWPLLWDLQHVVGCWQTHHRHLTMEAAPCTCCLCLLCPGHCWAFLSTPAMLLSWSQSFQVLLAPAPICCLSLFPFCTEWKCSRCSTDTEESQEAVTGNTVFSHSLQTEAQKELSSVSCCSETCYRKM